MSNEPEFRDKPRRAPMIPVPGPNAQSISERAIAMRQPAPNPQDAQPLPPLMSYDSRTGAMGLAPTGVGQVAKAVSSVMREVGTIEKRGYNEHFKYHYAKMEDVLEALTPLIGKHGLTIFQNEREIKMEGNNRMAITYEFSVIHESGEFWPEKIRQTGTAIARDSKGNLDDKAVAKCHSNARKYFLLALFQVPAGDFEDPDADDRGNGKSKPVPGPGLTQKPASTPQADDDKIPMQDTTKPHKLVMPQGTSADQWASAYLKAIGKAKSVEEMELWDKLNDDFLQRISDRYPKIYEMLTTAVARRTADVAQEPAGMPADIQEAMNWVATQLSQANTYEFAEQFWNQYVAPQEAKFDPVDWELLMREWQRAEERFGKSAPNS